MTNFTCLNCEKRHPSCHSTCEKYQAECRANELAKAEVAMRRKILHDVRSAKPWNR